MVSKFLDANVAVLNKNSLYVEANRRRSGRHLEQPRQASTERYIFSFHFSFNNMIAPMLLHIRGSWLVTTRRPIQLLASGGHGDLGDQRASLWTA